VKVSDPQGAQTKWTSGQMSRRYKKGSRYHHSRALLVSLVSIRGRGAKYGGKDGSVGALVATLQCTLVEHNQNSFCLASFSLSGIIVRSKKGSRRE
jgi:hypothetical protein